MKQSHVPIMLGLLVVWANGAAVAPASEVVDFREAFRETVASVVRVEVQVQTEKFGQAAASSPGIAYLGAMQIPGATQPASPQPGTSLGAVQQLRNAQGSRLGVLQPTMPKVAKVGEDGTLTLLDQAAAQQLAQSSRLSTLIGNPSNPWVGSTGKQYSCGVVVSSDGLIATAILPEGSITVTLSDGTEHAGQVVVRDDASKSSLIKIKAEGLPAIELIDEEVELGQPVGAAFYNGRDPSVGVGIVTQAINWDPSLFTNHFATSITCPVGASGAPVIDGRGQLAGLVFATRSVDPRLQPGPAYVLPASDIARMISVVPESGQTTLKRGIVGMRLADDGKVEQVSPDTPAEEAGIRAGDVVQVIDNENVGSAREVIGLVNRFRAGDEITIAVDRDGETQEFTLMLESMDPRARRTVVKPAGESAAANPAPVNPQPTRVYTSPTPPAPYQVKPQPYRTPQPAEQQPTAQQPIVVQQPNAYQSVIPSVQVPQTVQPNSPYFQVQRSNLEETMRTLQVELKELRSEIRKLRSENSKRDEDR